MKGKICQTTTIGVFTTADFATILNAQILTCAFRSLCCACPIQAEAAVFQQLSIG